LNVETGQKAWVYEAPDQIRCSTTIVDNRGFVAGCDGFLHIIDLENGQQIGSVEILSPTGVTPAILDNSLFVGIEQGVFLGIDWQKSELIWKFEDPNGTGSIRGSPAVVDQHVVFGARNRNVYSLNPKTGTTNWTTTLKSAVDSSPVIVGSRVFVAATDGRLYELELASGKIIWEKQFDGGFIGSPAVAFGRLVIASDRGVVYCLGERN
jgi:outer membrane protein assembly factor BamB